MDIWFEMRRILRSILALLDGSIYTICAELYDLMIDIAEAKIFTDDAVLDIGGRVYQLLGLIMLFRLIFAFLTYVVNPEGISDKTKGIQNIIKKIIISLILIVVTPWAFTQSRNLQIYIIKDGLIEYFINGEISIDNVSPGYKMMSTTAKLFIAPYKCNGSNCSECLMVDNVCQTCSGDWTKLTGLGLVGSDNCSYGVGFDGVEGTFSKALQSVNKPIPTEHGIKYDLYALTGLIGYGNQNANPQMFMDLKYPFVGTTLIGIAIGYMLLVMCIDVAVRSVKLGFYEIMAPIPIVSYIGFKDGKDAMLSKWFTQVLKTYADLFTRVIALQFAIFIINELVSGNAIEKNGMFVSLFIILGALTFAKKLPSILKELGINFEGGGSFNLKKKLNDEMAGSKLMKRAGAAGLGFAGGMAANAYKGASNAYKRKTELKKAMQDGGFKNKSDFFKANADNKQYGNYRERREYAARNAKNAAMAAASAKGLSHDDQIKMGNKAWKEANKTYDRENASKRGGNIIAGALSGAYNAATTKDGKMFAGAREGIKESTDARDLRDKREEAGYGATTRFADSARTLAGVDTKAKEKANNLRDQISQLETNAYAYQQQASSNLQSAMSLQHFDSSGKLVNLTQSDITDYLANPGGFNVSGMTTTEISQFDQWARGYDNALKQNAELNTQITKTKKKLGLYEKEQK